MSGGVRGTYTSKPWLTGHPVLRNFCRLESTCHGSVQTFWSSASLHLMRLKNCSFSLTMGPSLGEHWAAFPGKIWVVSPDVYFSYCCAKEQIFPGTVIESINSVISWLRKTDVYNNT